jgi:hypothetical protein
MVTKYDGNGRAASLAGRAEYGRRVRRVGVLDLNEPRAVDLSVRVALRVPLALFHDGEIEANRLASRANIGCVLLGDGQTFRVGVGGKQLCQSEVVSLREKVVRPRKRLRGTELAVCSSVGLNHLSHQDYRAR